MARILYVVYYIVRNLDSSDTNFKSITATDEVLGLVVIVITVCFMLHILGSHHKTSEV